MGSDCQIETNLGFVMKNVFNSEAQLHATNIDELISHTAMHIIIHILIIPSVASMLYTYLINEIEIHLY